jgi:hypothetical protein
MASLVVCLGGCDLLVSDSASRTAFALREGARRLAGSSDSIITVRVTPRQWPRGCAGAYRLTLAPDSAAVPGLAIHCLPTGPIYTSGGALPQVRTRHLLTADFRATEPVTLVLRRAGSEVEASHFTDE